MRVFHVSAFSRFRAGSTPQCLQILQAFCHRVFRAMADILAKPDSDFRFQLEEVSVDVGVHKKITESKFTWMQVFAGLEESRSAVRAALKTTCGFQR